MSKSPSRMDYEFSHQSIQKKIVEFVNLGYGNTFHLLASEHLLQMNFWNKWLNLTYLFPYMIG